MQDSDDTMSPNTEPESVPNSGRKICNIAVKEFAKVLAECNVNDDAFLKNGSKKSKEPTDRYSYTMDGDHETEEPVSPPACGEEEHPGLIISGDSKDYYETATKTLSSMTQMQQQKLQHLKSQLSRLPPTKLKELNTALKDHIRKLQEKAALEKIAVESLLSMKTRNVQGQILEHNDVEEGDGKQTYPGLIPLTISEIDQTPKQTSSNTAMASPSLHMSCGKVTMAEESSEKGMKQAMINWSRSKTANVYEEGIAREQRVDQVSPNSRFNRIPPNVQASLKDGQNLKRSPVELPEVVYSKRCKIEVAEESTEGKTATNTDTMYGISIFNKPTTSRSDSIVLTGKPKSNLSKDPLPELELFMRDLLHNPKSNPKILSWEDVEEGVFRIVNLEAFFQAWRDVKHVPITYDLLRKSINLSKQYETLLKMPKTRCVYMFGKHAMNWKPKKETVEENDFEQFDTFECKLVFPAQDSEKAVLEIENKLCVEIDRKVFLKVLSAENHTLDENVF
eukprot:GFUD01067203.1.p1 GENE.GFUD01067203.1~~GFUD01067203.1.p1  ORF type:complete len:507 (-),score=141.48 GFUD01067203.1:223-1743(-)